jgi:hypothetical protein
MRLSSLPDFIGWLRRFIQLGLCYYDLVYCRGHLTATLCTGAAWSDNTVVPGARRGEGLAELGPEIDAVHVTGSAEAPAGGPPGDSVAANVRLSITNTVD